MKDNKDQTYGMQDISNQVSTHFELYLDPLKQAAVNNELALCNSLEEYLDHLDSSSETSEEFKLNILPKLIASSNNSKCKCNTMEWHRVAIDENTYRLLLAILRKIFPTMIRSPDITILDISVNLVLEVVMHQEQLNQSK